MSQASRERVQTARLVCERLRAEHAGELLDHLRDPRVARTMSPRGEPPSEVQVRQRLEAKIAHWDRLGFGVWLLRDRQSGQAVGQGGLQSTFLAGCNEIEVGWSIAPERWGQGLATELAHAAVDVAFDDLRLPEIIAFTRPSNRASRRVMEKARFVLERRVMHLGLEHVLYRRKREFPSSLNAPPLPDRRDRPPADPLATLQTSAPLTQSREARKEHVANPHGRTRPR